MNRLLDRPSGYGSVAENDKDDPKDFDNETRAIGNLAHVAELHNHVVNGIVESFRVHVIQEILVAAKFPHKRRIHR